MITQFWSCKCASRHLSTLLPEQGGRNFADDFVNEEVYIWNKRIIKCDPEHVSCKEVHIGSGNVLKQWDETSYVHNIYFSSQSVHRAIKYNYRALCKIKKTIGQLQTRLQILRNFNSKWVTRELLDHAREFSWHVLPNRSPLHPRATIQSFLVMTVITVQLWRPVPVLLQQRLIITNQNNKLHLKPGRPQEVHLIDYGHYKNNEIYIFPEKLWFTRWYFDANFAPLRKRRVR